jgi:hypothetical protein
LAAGGGQSYDADTKTMTMGTNTTVQEFMDNVVENIGRKKISAELVDGRMEIKTLDNTAISLRSDPAQVDGVALSTKDLEAMIAAAREGAKGTPTTADVDDAMTIGDLKASIQAQMADLKAVQSAADAVGNTDVAGTAAALNDLQALSDAITATGLADTAVVGADGGGTAGSLMADAGFVDSYANQAAINAVAGAASGTNAAQVVDGARTELATQQIKVGTSTISLTGTETLKSLVGQITAESGGTMTASIDGNQVVIKGTADATNPYEVATGAIELKKGATPGSAAVALSTVDTAQKNTSFNDMLGFDNGHKITITADMTAEDLRVALNNIDGVTADFNDKGNLIIKGTEGDDFIITSKDGNPASLLGIEGSATNGNNARASYARQFDGVMAQIDQLVQDTGYKGINLLNGDDLMVNFNETRTSTLEIKGVKFDSKGIGLTVSNNEWKGNVDIEKSLTQLEKASSILKAQASEFGQNLATVQTREDFTNNMINNLVSGSDKLTLADMNEEAANMLALQTRQQLATNSLSMASQAAQGVLRLF